MDLIHAFGHAVRIAREQSGLTQQQLSEESGVHSVSLSRLERGTSEARLLTMEALAGALGMSLSELLRRAEGLQSTQGKVQG